MGHLFTYTSFSSGTQGIAWIGKSGSVGGICAPGSKNQKYNTGWTSSLDSQNQKILTLESILVTAHGKSKLILSKINPVFVELGHNFGSLHDPETCIPKENGNYLMYTYSVSGKFLNNKVLHIFFYNI